MIFKQGIIVSDPDVIWSNFLQRNNIYFEFIAALPIDLLSLVIGQRFLNLLRLTKVLRFYKVANYQDSVENIVAASKFRMSQALRRVLNLNFVMLVFCHLVGCIWYMSADLSIELGLESNWKDADINDQSLAVDHSELGGTSGYLRSVYWAIVGMSTVGMFLFDSVLFLRFHLFLILY